MRNFTLRLMSTLLLVFATVWGGQLLADELTVYENATNTSGYVPFNGLYADYGTRSQFIIPAEELADMTGGTISQLTFYSNTASLSYDEVVTVYMTEVDYTTFATAALEDWNQMTPVYTGTLTVTGGLLELELSDSYVYGGSNLMIGFQVTTWGSSCPSSSWFGQTQTSGTYTAAYNNANSSHSWSSSVSRVAFIPKTTFEYTPGSTAICSRPSKPGISSITAHSAELIWSSSASAFELVVASAGGSSVDTYFPTDTTFALTGLDADSTYLVRLRAICAAGDTSKVVSTTFTTPCDALTELGNIWTFEDVETGSSMYNLPDCWSAIKSGNYPYVYSSTYSSYGGSSKCLYFSTATPQIAILPPYQAGLIQTARVQFYYKNSYTSATYPQFIVGTMSNPNDASTFVAADTLDRVSTYTLAKVDLANAPAGHNFIAIKYANGTSSGAAYIDNLEVGLIPDCKEPANLQVVAVTDNSATISWTPGGEETLWQYLLLGDKDVLSEDDVFEVTEEGEESILTLTDLEPDSAYVLYIRSECGGEQSEMKSIAFKTACEPLAIEDWPWIESFEEMAMGSSTVGPDCWDVLNANDGTYPYIYVNTSTSYVKSGSKSLYFQSSNSRYGYAIFPIMDEVALNTLRIKFWHKEESATISGLLDLGYMTNPKDASTFVSLAQYTRSTAWQEEETFLSAIPAEVATTARLAFRYGDLNATASNYYMGIDSITIDPIPGCVRPSEVIVSNISTNSATLKWNSIGGANQWEYVLLSGEEELDWEDAITVNQDSVVLPNLTANTVYAFYIRTLCDEGEHSDSTMMNFLTECEVFSMPFAEDFEGDIYRCMALGNLNSTNSSYQPQWSDDTHSGEYALYLNAYVSTSSYSPTNANGCFAVLPEMNYGEAGLAAYTLSFWAKNYTSSYGSYYDSLTVCILINDSTYVPFTKVGVTSTYAQYDVPFTGLENSGRIMLLATVDPASTATSRYGRFYVDDVEVYRTPTCKPLQSIAASDVKRTSMVINFTPKTGEELSNIEVVYALNELDAAALESANKILVQDTNKLLLGNLERDTTYYIYARVACGAEGNSEWLSLVQKTNHLNNEAAIIVANGTSTGFVPVFGYNADAAQHTQSIYPAEMLTDLVGITFHKITYSISAASTKASWRRGQGSFQVGLAITEQTNLENDFASDELTNIYTGSLDASGTEMTITLNQPFTYTGGNLLIDFNLPEATGWESASFYGIEQPNGSRYVYGSTSASATDFLPKVAFVYEIEPEPCPSVTEMSYELLGTGTSAAMIRWQTADADYLSGYNVILSDSVITDFEGLQPTYANVQGDSIAVNGLSPLTEYYVYVQAICNALGHDEGSSDWAGISFATLANCPAIVELESELADGNAVSISWSTVLPDQALSFAYVVSTDSLNEAALAAAQKVAVNDTLAALIENLAYNQKYYIYVASACGDSYSPWTETEITTALSCAPVLNLTASRVESNLVVLTWNRSQFGKEQQWEAGIIGMDGSAVVVDTTVAMLIGLQPDSAYTAYVKALCPNGETSANATVQFTTEVASACETVGTGSSSSNMPVTNYDYAYTQMIYTAEEIGASGNILSIQFERSSYSNVMNNMKVYLGLTSKSTFASNTDWVPADSLIEVFSGSFGTGSSWLELPLAAPFAFDGTQNLVVAVSNGHGNYRSIQNFYYTSATNTVLTRRADGDATYAEHPGTAAGYNVSGTRTNMQFCFELSACPAVKAMKVADITTNSAKISWEPSGSETSWNVFLSMTELTDMTGVQFALVSSYVQPLTGLQSSQDYWYYVQPACGGDWKQISFTTIATCLPPVSLAVEEVTSSSAVVSWSSVDDLIAAGYIVAYGLADTFNLEDPTTYSTVQVTNMTATLNNLEANAQYTFAVKRICDETDSSVWSEELSFVTACEIFLVDAANPLLEDFEGDIDCWRIMGTGAYNWSLSSTQKHSGSMSAYSGYYGDIYLLLPKMHIADNAAAAYLTFWSINMYPSYYGKNSVVLLNDTIETELWSPESVIQSWVQDTIDLSAYIGQTISLAFKYEGNNAHGWYIDDVAVEALMPASVTVPASGYTTFYDSKNGYVLPSDMQAYAFNHVDSLVSIFGGNAIVPADLPMILRAEQGNYTLMPAVGGVMPNVINELVGTDTLLVVENDTNYVFYQLGLNAAQELDSIGFYWLNANGAAGDNFVVPAHQAYLKVAKAEGQPDHILFNACSGATNLVNFYDYTEKAMKIFHNGHFFILREGVIYDATGRKVDNLE